MVLLSLSRTEDYLWEAFRELDDEEVYEQLSKDLVNTIMKALGEIYILRDLSKDTLNYLLIKNPKFARTYLLLEIHKWLDNFVKNHSFQIASIILNTYPHFKSVNFQ